MQPVLDDLITWALEAGEILKAGFGLRHQVVHKGIIDLVTEIDHQSEALLVSRIRAKFPTDMIITEEQGLLDGAPERCWFIDPVDGTVNYAHGVPMFCVTLAYAEKGVVLLGVIYDPMRNECYTAERGKGAWLNGEPIHVSTATQLIDALLVTGFPYDRLTARENNLDHFSRLTLLSQGVRRLGSAAIDLAYVAAGRLEGFWEIKIGPYDIAAGTLIVEEAGGMISSFNGTADYLTPPCSIVAANPAIYPLLMEELHRE